MNLSYEDLISDVSINIVGIGHIKPPTLHDIWGIRYDTYQIMCNYLSVDKERYLEITNLKKEYDMLTDEGKKTNSFYNLIINNKEFLNMYFSMFSFFIEEKIEFNKNSQAFIVYRGNKENVITKNDIVGYINESNFDDIRNILLQINYLKSIEQEIEQPKYKNEFARKLAERMEKASSKKADQNNNLTLGKMISKYCASNKNGINMLNVHNLTLYQFYDQWKEFNHIRQCDIQDMIYANTVSFSDLKSYDSQLWLK